MIKTILKAIIFATILIGWSEGQTLPFRQIEKTSPPGSGSVVVTNTAGILTYTPGFPVSKWTNDAGYLTLATAGPVYVPYIGATASVDLGAQSFSTSGTSTIGTLQVTNYAIISTTANTTNPPLVVYSNTANLNGSIFTNNSNSLAIIPVTLSGGGAAYNGPWISTPTNENIHFSGTPGIPQLTFGKVSGGNNPIMINAYSTFTSSANLRVTSGGMANLIECEGTQNNLTWYLQKGTNTVNQALKGFATIGSTVLTSGQPSLVVVGNFSTATSATIHNAFIGQWSAGSGYAAVHHTAVTAATSYALVQEGSTGNTFLNSGGETRIAVLSTTKIQCGATFIQFSSNTVAGGTKQFEFVCSNGGSQTAGTNIPSFKITGANKQKSTGADPIQYFNHFSSNTISYVGASTAGTVANLAVEYPDGGTNATLTRNVAIHVPTKVVSNSTNAYGLYIEGASGATNNYAAVFTQGTGTVHIGEYSSGRGAIWVNQSSPSSSNFALSSDVSGNVFVNGPSSVRIMAGASIYFGFSANKFELGAGQTGPVNISCPSTNGTKIGITTSEKLGFWNATPIVQPTTAGAAATFVANTSGTLNDSATWDGYTIGQVVKALRNMGLLQ